ncbi:hypothetical protein GY45DRAFT_701475 [Cubamyces sp. BRFM 1775]|nr:hypothetical protein GY45DRAFT_701475 [Cubamyces sp. BRFM 1775]
MTARQAAPRKWLAAPQTRTSPGGHRAGVGVGSGTVPCTVSRRVWKIRQRSAREMATVPGSRASLPAIARKEDSCVPRGLYLVICQSYVCHITGQIIRRMRGRALSYAFIIRGVQQEIPELSCTNGRPNDDGRVRFDRPRGRQQIAPRFALAGRGAALAGCVMHPLSATWRNSPHRRAVSTDLVRMARWCARDGR